MERSTDQFIANLYRKNYRALYLHAYSMLGQRPEAEVALQEAFLVACKNPEEFMRKENPITWMEKVIENNVFPALYWSGVSCCCDDLCKGCGGTQYATVDQQVLVMIRVMDRLLQYFCTFKDCYKCIKEGYNEKRLIITTGFIVIVMSYARPTGKRNPGCTASAPGRISCAFLRARNAARRPFVVQYTNSCNTFLPNH